MEVSFLPGNKTEDINYKFLVELKQLSNHSLVYILASVGSASLIQVFMHVVSY